MCLVELKGAPKPIASCAWGVRDCRPGPNGEPPEVLTRSKLVKKAREGVMEFLLINHPLDCPICDQGGECDLQDQAMAYGVDTSRFEENKRAVEDKYIGPLVKTIMNRCIHCTRCIRFSTEVAGVSELGATGRGEDMEITTYLERAMTSELQANVVDLCPVGALTSKPYAFKARPWELSKTESIDVMDALGSNIRVDARGKEVMRILPRMNELVNEEWISDKTRYCVDGLGVQRLDRPYRPRRTAGCGRRPGRRRSRRSPSASRATSGERIGAIAGDLASVEEMFALKLLMQALGSPNIDCRQDGAALDPALGRGSYIFNATVAGIETADAVLIIGSNPRKEAPVLNARIRKRWRLGGLPIAVIGEHADLTYAYEHLGAGPDSLSRLVAGEGEFLQDAEGREAAADHRRAGRADRRRTARAVLSAAAQLAADVGAVDDDWIGLSILHTAARASAASTSASCRARAGSAHGDMLQRPATERSTCCSCSARTRSTCPDGAFVVYHRHAWRCRRAPRRRHPARRRLHRKIRHLGQHRGPRADRQPRRLPAGRRARGLVDPARAFRRARQDAAVRQPRASFARSSIRRIRTWPSSRRSSAARRKPTSIALRRSAARSAGPGVRQSDPRLLSDQPDRPRVRGAGRMLRHASRPGRPKRRSRRGR